MAYEMIQNLVGQDARAAARALGKKGGIARKRNLSIEQLHVIAVKGARARWDKRKDKPVAPPEQGE